MTTPEQKQWHVFGTAVCCCTDNEHFTENWASGTTRADAVKLAALLNRYEEGLKALREIAGQDFMAMRAQGISVGDRSIHLALNALDAWQQSEGGT